MIPSDNQWTMSERMAPRKIVTLAASHVSLASKVEDVAALIVEAAAPARQ